MSALRSTFLIHSAVRIDLRHFLEDQSWAYQKEMLYYLFNDWSIIIALFTLFNALKIMKINRKCLKQKILKRSQKCRNLYYFLNVSQFTHEMLMFLNKSAVNEHMMLSWGEVTHLEGSARNSIGPRFRIHGTLLVRRYWLLLIGASRAEFPFSSFYSKASKHHSRHLLPDVWPTLPVSSLPSRSIYHYYYYVFWALTTSWDMSPLYNVL